MTPFAYVQLGFFLAATLWTWFKVRPFMDCTMRAALRSLAVSEEVSLTLAEIRQEVAAAAKTVSLERVEKLLAAAERLAGGKPPLGVRNLLGDGSDAAQTFPAPPTLNP